MSAIFQPLWRIRQFLGIDLPQPRPAATPTPKVPQLSQGTMKKPKALPIKTFGTGQESMDIYGAIPLSKEQVQIETQKAKLEASEHEKEISAPILSFQKGGAAIGTSSGGIGLSDQEFLRRTMQWELGQKALVADRNSIRTILPNAHGSAPVKTFHN